MILRAPFPFFGGKSKVASRVWQAFGDVSSYVEPFFGSGAVLLSRPGSPGIETINDVNCYVSNFWRSVQRAPQLVARWADQPVIEVDLEARHIWLETSLQTEMLRERLPVDPDYFDAQIAGWWLWGMGLWIGSGWCAGTGKIAKGLPHLSGEGGASGRGIFASGKPDGVVYDWMEALAQRLRRVRVCCGDFERVLGPAVTTCIGVTGVFFDPPYPSENRKPTIYGVHDDKDVAGRARDWAIEHGEDSSMRIALCGYEGEHQMPGDWEVFEWKSAGGNAKREEARENSERERIWFSPGCLGARQRLLAL